MTTAGVPNRTPRAWPFVGRALELARVEAALTEGSAAGVLLIGGRGVGKTTLASAAISMIGGPPPARVVASGPRSASLASIAHLLPTSQAPSGPTDLRRQAIEALTDAEPGSIATVVVDDAHLLDDASAGVIHQVAAVGAARFVITAQRGATLPEPIVRLWAEGVVAEVEVAPLPADDVSSLVTAALGGHVEGWTRHELLRLAGGNLFLLKELVDASVRTGALVADGGIWRWNGTVVLTERAKAVVGQRLCGRSPQETRVLRALALAGALELSILNTFAPLDLLERLAEEQLVRITRQGRRLEASLTEPFDGELVRAGASELAEARIFNELADALDATDLRRGKDVARLATWRVRGGQVLPAALLGSAVDVAFRTGDYHLAEQLTTAAVEAGGGHHSRHALARALVGLERPDEAEAILESLDPTTTTVEDRVQVALTRSLNLFLGLHRVDQAEQVLLDAEESVGDRARQEFTATRSFFRYSLGRLGDACELAAQSLAGDGADVKPRAAVRALGVRAASLSLMGRPEDAIVAADEAIAILSQGDDSFFPSQNQLSSVRWDGLWFAGRLDQAEDLARRQYREAIETENGSARGPACLQLGLCARARGRVRTAVDWLQESILLLADHNAPALVPALAALAQAAALAGEIEVATTALQRCQRRSRHPSGASDARVQLTEAWIAASRGDVLEAQRLAVASAETARRAEATTLEVIAFHDLARIGEPSEAARSLRARRLELQGSLLPLVVAHVQAMADGDPAALDDAALRFEEMGMLLLGAESAAQASRAYLRARQPGRARASRARALGLHAQCEGARTPALGELDSPDVLTPREREVAVLAARGMRNQQIADQLTISVRTVDNILHRLYAKLGIDGRGELAAAL